MRLTALLARCLLLPALWLAAGTASTQVPSEAQVKAAYLFNFLKYVEWPDNASHLTICLYGRDTLSAQLASYEGRAIGNRTLRIRRISVPEQLAECHQVFIADIEEGRFAGLLRATANLPVLTVSDNEHFVREGGAIALFLDNQRLQFDVNVDALQRAGLKPASQMLRLARQIVGRVR